MAEYKIIYLERFNQEMKDRGIALKIEPHENPNPVLFGLVLGLLEDQDELIDRVENLENQLGL